MYRLTEEEQQWISKIWDKIDLKMEETVKRNCGKIPYFARNGIFDDKFSVDPCWWTNGFWAGMMWLLYMCNKKNIYMEEAVKSEEKLDKAFYEYYGLHHDVGFMWKLSAGAQYELTGNETSKKRCLIAANILASRFNVNGGFIQAWNGKEHSGVSIIDSMMNLPLLYWASRESEDDRYKYVAIKHANKTIETHIREDFSVNHIVKYNYENGEVTDTLGGQGYSKGSSWSRGQAWAIYGFILSYIHTGDKKYLDISKKCADYFISCVKDDWLPRSDFRAPAEPIVYDSSAGACAVSGFIELAKVLNDDEGKKYIDAAMNILRAMEKNFCNWDPEYDSILQYASEAYAGTRDISLIYGDYFFVEAIGKLKGNEILLW